MGGFDECTVVDGYPTFLIGLGGLGNYRVEDRDAGGGFQLHAGTEWNVFVNNQSHDPQASNYVHWKDLKRPIISSQLGVVLGMGHLFMPSHEATFSVAVPISLSIFDNRSSPSHQISVSPLVMTGDSAALAAGGSIDWTLWWEIIGLKTTLMATHGVWKGDDTNLTAGLNIVLRIPPMLVTTSPF